MFEGYAAELLGVLVAVSIANLGFMAVVVRKLSSLETKVNPLWKAYVARAKMAQKHKQRADGGVDCPNAEDDDR